MVTHRHFEQQQKNRNSFSHFSSSILFNAVYIDYGIFNDTLKLVVIFSKLFFWTREWYTFQVVQLILVRYADTDDKIPYQFVSVRFYSELLHWRCCTVHVNSATEQAWRPKILHWQFELLGTPSTYIPSLYSIHIEVCYLYFPFASDCIRIHISWLQRR